MATPDLPTCRWLIAALTLIAGGTIAGEATAQMSLPNPASSGVNYLFSADMAPGMVGAARLQRRGAVQGYYQPVAFSGPEGLRFALAVGNGFEPEGQTDLRAGLRVGTVYRFKLTHIPNAPGSELFPTIEIIDRTYPPAGQANRFPIPIVLEADDIEQAINGKLVTRVIYLEDPQTALPIAQEPDTARAIDVGRDQDALQVADRFGRPVAIVRLGSLAAPSAPQLMPQFFFGSPPWHPIAVPRSEAIVPEGETATIRTPHIPRDDITPTHRPPAAIPSSVSPRVARPYPGTATPQTIPSNRSWLR